MSRARPPGERRVETQVASSDEAGVVTGSASNVVATLTADAQIPEPVADCCACRIDV